MEINKIYNENCLDTMSKMPENFIDLTITSPPYDNLRTYNDNIDKTWNEDVWREIIKELYRVTKKGGVVVWIVGDATINGSETGTSFKQALFAKECGFNLHDTMIYQKNSYTFPQPNRYYQVFEYMFVLSKGNPKVYNIQRVKTKYKRTDKSSYRNKDGTIEKMKYSVGNDTRKDDNIWKFNVGFGISSTDKISFKHPATFPEKLVEKHIISWSNEGDLIYDCFMGSGTTAKMAILNKRNFIGSELSKEYCDIAEERLKKVLENPTLF